MLREHRLELAENVTGTYFKDSLGIYHWGIEKRAENGNIVSLAHGATRTPGYDEAIDEAEVVDLIRKHWAAR